ncbi:MAG: transcriptional regulator [Limisphaerales bacterium]
MNSRRILPVLAAVLLASITAGRAQAPAAAPGGGDDLANVLAVFRSDLNQAKVRTINEVMQLTGPEAERFWPIYRDYERELAKLGDERLALIRRFAQEYAGRTLADDSAREISRDWLRLQRRRLDLWEKYQGRVAKALSPVRAAQFLQVEHQLALFVDINIVAEMPLVGEAAAR